MQNVVQRVEIFVFPGVFCSEKHLPSTLRSPSLPNYHCAIFFMLRSRVGTQYIMGNVEWSFQRIDIWYLRYLPWSLISNCLPDVLTLITTKLRIALNKFLWINLNFSSEICHAYLWRFLVYACRHWQVLTELIVTSCLKLNFPPYTYDLYISYLPSSK